MTASALVPQFALQRDVPIAALAEQRRGLDPDARISLTDQLVAAIARGLVEHPRLNAILIDDGKTILELAGINIGIAFAMPDGLVTPPILAADRLSLAELATERRAVGKAAAEGRLDAAVLAEVTFTLSNLGPFGISRFTALVAPPQAAILAVGAPAANGLLTLSLSCDHRVVDGAPAAECLATIAGLLEQPNWMRALPGAELPA
jgi:pyruvate dehydrogenase E2 component (dihydrolipoamide acetyltransferase)